MTPAQEKKLDRVIGEVAEIKRALVGNDELETTGIIQKVYAHDKVIEEFKAVKNQGKGVVITIGVIWAILTFGIPFLVSYWFNK